jgi:hypothetical protein
LATTVLPDLMKRISGIRQPKQSPWQLGRQASAPTADVELLVEFLVQLLLLGIEIRHHRLLGLLCRGARSKLLCPRLQMTDRRITGYDGRGTNN